MISSNGLLDILFSNVTNEVIDALRIKLYIVGVIIVLTVIHMTISMMRLNKEKSTIEKLLSRGSSMGIFLLNLVVLHYAMVLRDILEPLFLLKFIFPELSKRSNITGIIKRSVSNESEIKPEL